MPSPFDLLDAAVQATVDATFGEGITIRPQTGDGNYTGGADGARPVRIGVRATVARAPSIKPTDFNNSNRNGAPVAMMAPEIWIDALAYAAIGYGLRRGDIIELADGAKFTIADARKGDNGDVQVILAGV